MNDKTTVVNGLHRVAGFVDALVSEGHEELYVDYLRAAADFINQQPSHEEFKASWLTILNTLHRIDPNWQENYAGNEHQKAIAFIEAIGDQLATSQRAIEQHQRDIRSLRSQIRDSHAAIHRINSRLTVCSQELEHERLRTAPKYPSAVVREATAQILDALAGSSAESIHPGSTFLAALALRDKADHLAIAAIKYAYQRGSLEAVRKEATQVGAMAIHTLTTLPHAKTGTENCDVNAGWFKHP
ncbi:hypothetical protein [Serratia marcescens]|uniref:hypothetical protein n=1 Tax=Serratia marcescens TaxID=615 RepID=UPI002875CCD0|nr:hypothetical protein [Serratia marcescens]MDS0826046.1 hypothetical protein [Serratia marcescens]